MAVGGLVTAAAILLFDPPWWRIVTVSAPCFLRLERGGSASANAGPRDASGLFASRSVAAVASAGTW